MSLKFISSHYFLDIMPWVLGVTISLMVLFIFWKFWRKVSDRKVRRTGQISGMQFQDIDRMKKQGVISEEEYRSIRRAMANREVQGMAERKKLEEEQQILERAEINPDALRQLLTPEQLAQADHPQAAAQPRATHEPARVEPIARTPATSTQLSAAPTRPPGAAPAQPVARQPATPPRPPGTAKPKAQPQPQPSMNMPRVVQARQHPAQAQSQSKAQPKAKSPAQPKAKPKGELELLLEKGAISPEEYKRLKKFFVEEK